MRSPIDADQIRAAISKTGFPLEHYVTEAFKRARWSVLSNRYYVDDIDGRARELDLIAYKVEKTKDLDVVTSVLISCKKDAQKTWAFLTRPRDPADRNIDWAPVHVWTDLEPLRTFLDNSEWRGNLVDLDSRTKRFAFHVDTDAFAFQEIAPAGQQQKTAKPNAQPNPAKTATPQNDSAIFNAVTGLLKALDSEMTALADRAADRKRLYFFTLAVVVDAPMVAVSFGVGDPDVEPIESLLHLARFMVRKRHFNAQVRFVGADKVDWFIRELNKLSAVNTGYFGGLVQSAYEAIKSNGAVRTHFSPLLLRRLRHPLNEILERSRSKEKITELTLLQPPQGPLLLELDIEVPAVEILNQSPRASELAAKALNDICRYTGTFAFDADIPF